MKKEIENRIIELGGTCDFKGESLKDDLSSISFPHSLLYKLSSSEYDEEEEDYYSWYKDDIAKLYTKLSQNGSVPYEELSEMGWGHFDFNILPREDPTNEDDFEVLFIGWQHTSVSDIACVRFPNEIPDNPTIQWFDIQDVPPPGCIYDDNNYEQSLEDFLNELLSPEEYSKMCAEILATKTVAF